jgi:hypothetical protein
VLEDLLGLHPLEQSAIVEDIAVGIEGAGVFHSLTDVEQVVQEAKLVHDSHARRGQDEACADILDNCGSSLENNEVDSCQVKGMSSRETNWSSADNNDFELVGSHEGMGFLVW